MKQITLLFSFMIVAYTAIAQDSLKTSYKNALYIELGGNGILASANYERMFYSKNKIHLCARVGFSLLRGINFKGPKWESFIIFPIEVNMLMGTGKKFFETGLGLSHDFKAYKVRIYQSDGSYRDQNYHNDYLFIRFGYRYQSQTGFLFRAAATPVIFYEIHSTRMEWERNRSLKIYPWVGITFGYSF